MALFAGALGGSLLTPVLGMIPQAPGGPPNPFAPSGGGGSSNPLGGLFSGLGSAFSSITSSVKSVMPNMNMVLLVGGGVVLLVLLR